LESLNTKRKDNKRKVININENKKKKKKIKKEAKIEIENNIENKIEKEDKTKKCGKLNLKGMKCLRKAHSCPYHKNV
jgi:hypothetical protein